MVNVNLSSADNRLQ